jgi:hypothetical protein
MLQSSREQRAEDRLLNIEDRDRKKEGKKMREWFEVGSRTRLRSSSDVAASMRMWDWFDCRIDSRLIDVECIKRAQISVTSSQP